MSKPSHAPHSHADSRRADEGLTMRTGAGLARGSGFSLPDITGLRDGLPDAGTACWARLAPYAGESGFAEFQALLSSMARWERAGVLNPEEPAFVVEEAGAAPESRQLLFRLCKHAAASEENRIASYFAVHAAALQMATLRQRAPWQTAMKIASAEVLQHTLTCAVLASGHAKAAIARARSSGAGHPRAAASSPKDVTQAHETLLMLQYQLGARLGFPARLKQAPDNVAPIEETKLAVITRDLQAIRSDPETMASALLGRPAWRVLLQSALARTPRYSEQATGQLSPQRRELLFKLATLQMLKDASLTS